MTGLYKSFGRTRALDGLNMEIPAGEVHGFLGPNGAGKTTTLRIFLGLLRADSGTVRVLGGIRGAKSSICTAGWRTSAHVISHAAKPAKRL